MNGECDGSTCIEFIESTTSPSFPAGAGGLERDHKIMVDQPRSIDKRRLIKKIGQVDKEVLKKNRMAAVELISPP